jgi:hypothetical protein
MTTRCALTGSAKTWGAYANIASVDQKFTGKHLGRRQRGRVGRVVARRQYPGRRIEGDKACVPGQRRFHRRPEVIVKVSSDWGANWLTRVNLDDYCGWRPGVAANAWRTVEIPLSAFGASGKMIDRIAIPTTWALSGHILS